ncbi:hypothetical protein JYU34_009500 [Plutella xylostella]|uniref:Uncharacterized protein n=1 Tax=Plutella xylostella TaxID=51655 RepID=A0ABQ7QJM5_PLUXY|nr:hypothetical protein JYU34_009500 [Plutella xylostella]
MDRFVKKSSAPPKRQRDEEPSDEWQQPKRTAAAQKSPPEDHDNLIPEDHDVATREMLDIMHQDSIWNEKLSKVDNPSSDLWRIAKSVRSDTPTSIPPLSRPDGTFTQSRQDQCEELATAFHNNMCLTTAWDSGETDIEVNMSIECLRNMEEGLDSAMDIQLFNNSQE